MAKTAPKDLAEKGFHGSGWTLLQSNFLISLSQSDHHSARIANQMDLICAPEVRS